MRFLKPTMIIFALLIAVILTLAVMQVFFGYIYPTEGTITITVCLIIFSLTVIVGLFGQKFSIKKFGFYLLHLGLVLFIIGSLIYRYSGVYAEARVSISHDITYSKIETNNGDIIDLGFSFNVTEFLIEYYEPVYDIYQREPLKMLKSDIAKDSMGDYDFGEYGKYNISELEQGDDIVKVINLHDNIAAVVRMPVSFYQGIVNISFPGEAEFSRSISVNNPLKINGYKIYLMSYISETNQVVLAFKRDYGETLSDISIYLIIIGVIYGCLVAPILNKNKFLRGGHL